MILKTGAYSKETLIWSQKVIDRNTVYFGGAMP